MDSWAKPLTICFVSEALRAALQSGDAGVRAFFGHYLPGICADLGLTSPELPHTEAAVCLGFLGRMIVDSAVSIHIPLLILLCSIVCFHLVLIACPLPPHPPPTSISVQVGGLAASGLPQGGGRVFDPLVRRVRCVGTGIAPSSFSNVAGGLGGYYAGCRALQPSFGLHG